jgi:hypothetical protein
MLPNPAKCHTMQHQDFRYCYNNIQHQLKLRLEYGGTAQGALELNQSVEMCTTERVLALNLSDISARRSSHIFVVALPKYMCVMLVCLTTYHHVY